MRGHRSIFVETALVIIALVLGITVTAQEPVNVKILSIELAERLLKVQYGDKVRALEIAPDAVITQAGESADLQSLLPGDEVSVVYDREAAHITRIDARRGKLLPA